MKYLVETPGEHMLFDLFAMQEISAHRPSVVRVTPFIEAMLGKKLKKLDVLTDEADDATLEGAVDLEAALASLPREKKAAPQPKK